MKAILVLAIIFLLLPVTISAKEICIDTDSKYSSPESKRGYVQTIDSIFWDDCNGNILIEQYCLDGEPKIKEVNCKKGCNRGACSRYSLFKAPRLKLPAISKLDEFISKVYPKEKKVSGYESDSINTKEINSALRDIDRRLSLIEANLPEQSAFPIIIESNKNNYKAAYSNGKVIIVDARGTIAELSTSANLKNEMELSEFYKAISESESRAITRRGKALLLAAAQ